MIFQTMLKGERSSMLVKLLEVLKADVFLKHCKLTEVRCRMLGEVASHAAAMLANVGWLVM